MISNVLLRFSEPRSAVGSFGYLKDMEERKMKTLILYRPLDCSPSGAWTNL